MVNTKSVLYCVCILQFACLLYYYSIHPTNEGKEFLCNPDTANTQTIRNVVMGDGARNDVDIKQRPSGAAVTLMHNQPAWFQRRYTAMIYNVLNNIPSSWPLQIFHIDNAQFWSGLDLNKGLKRLIEKSDRIHLTKIPQSISSERKRPIHLMLHPWIWEQMLADKVLLFSGNHVICSNSPFTIENFMSYDYIGAPWGLFKGGPGGGGISLRNRTVMLSILSQETEKLPKNERLNAYQSWGREDEFFVSRMLRARHKFILPSYEVIEQFSAYGKVANVTAFTVSDPLPSIPWDTREEMTKYCPEMKILYPSIHEPGCFGAVLDREKCAKSICALNPKKRSC